MTNLRMHTAVQQTTFKPTNHNLLYQFAENVHPYTV